jgi:alkyl hydroperoxide reductase subunit AhpC
MQAQVGKPAPDFELKSTKNATSRNDLGFKISLSDYRGKWLVFFFYPLDFTFVCPTEITAFSDAIGKFTEVGAEVLGASCDSVFSHWAWIQQPRDQNGIAGLKYPLVADYKKEVARAYGVLDEDAGEAQRGLFIIDPEGIVRYATVTNSNIGRSVDETLRVLQALQTGARCPADWKPGKPTLVVSG